MRELALHILDLVRNSMEAGSANIWLTVIENYQDDVLIIRVKDDGCGMDKAMCRMARDPFFSTRTTRRIGLGLPLIDMYTSLCDGGLLIESAEGKGTVVEASFQYSHIDRAPLGNMVDTIKTILITAPEVNFFYKHKVNENEFKVSSKELTTILGDIPLSHPEVISWVSDYLTENMARLYGGVKLENT